MWGSESSFSSVLTNELLVKLNQVQRIFGSLSGEGGLPASVIHTRSLSPIKNVFHIFLFKAVVFGSFLALIFLRKPSCSLPDSVFLYVDKRLLKFSSNGLPAYRIGLHKYLIGREQKHLYKHLTLHQLLQCVGYAFPLRKRMAKHILEECNIAGFSGQQLLSLSGLGYLRCLDLLLARAAISKLSSVECAGHFDIYTALISQLRYSDEIEHFTGVQHGLFEYFSFAKPSPLFFDEYRLLFSESESYYLQYMNANRNCILRFQSKKGRFDHCNDLRQTVAVALQNDDMIADEKLLCELQSIAKGNFSALAYVHPATSHRGLARLRTHFPGIRFESKLRCENIAMIITRYSTLAMDYVSVGVPAIFWAAPDRVCVSFSGHPLIREINELNELSEVVRSILSSDGDASS